MYCRITNSNEKMLIRKVGKEIKSKEIGVIKEGLVSQDGSTSVKGLELKGSRF